MEYTIRKIEDTETEHDIWFNDGAWVHIDDNNRCWEYDEDDDPETYHSGNFMTDTDYGIEVIDYDGTFELPDHVIQALEKCGYDCSYIKEII